MEKRVAPFEHPRFYRAPEPALRLWLWLRPLLLKQEKLVLTPGQLWAMAKENRCEVGRRSLVESLEGLKKAGMLDVERHGHTLTIRLKYEAAA